MIESIDLRSRVDEVHVLRLRWFAQAERLVTQRDDGWRVVRDVIDRRRPYLLVRNVSRGVIEVLGTDYMPLRLEKSR